MDKKIFFVIAFTLLSGMASAQTFTQKAPMPDEYYTLVKEANAFYNTGDYQKAADAYTKAFQASGDKGMTTDFYDAACAYALAGDKETAFKELKVLGPARFNGYNHMMIDPDLESLHNDTRWDTVAAAIKQNKERNEADMDKELVSKLDTIMQDDQKYRMKISKIETKYGKDSKEMKDLWQTINKYDSIDLIKTTAIIDKYGWPGPSMAGREGSQAVFLVIQHADIKTQDKYLPVMRKAVENKEASPASLALLEDRVALRHGQKQTYGSQITTDAQGSYLAPLTDPDNVDKRRREAGLGPLADYLLSFGLKWDVETYKKQLPELEQREKNIHYE